MRRIPDNPSLALQGLQPLESAEGTRLSVIDTTCRITLMIPTTRLVELICAGKRRRWTLRPLDVVLFMGTLVLSACSGVNTDHLLLTTHPVSTVPDTHSIEILTDSPARSYRKLAQLEATEYMGATWEDMRAALVEEARKVGADAIMDLKMGGERKEVLLGGRGDRELRGTSQLYKTLTGIAIRYQ